MTGKVIEFYSILFYSILFYSILFYSILFYSKEEAAAVGELLLSDWAKGPTKT